MKKIYKYQLEPTEKQVLQLPEDAVILTVQMQDNKICLWATLVPNEEKQNRNIHIIGTGNEFDESLYLSYIATFKHDGHVFHVFEEI